MNIQLLYLCGFLTLAVPFFAVAAAFSHYLLQRRSLRRRRRFTRAIPGLYPASMALGMVFLLVQTFYRASVSYAVEARLVEDAGEIDEGDEETLAKQLNRQLRSIRRGEPLDRLVLRL
ncbi:MAG TPA: hypothetical protein VHX11_12050 [Acidobacteriaceae bacterium]|jgi:hypothetical protein|nr:hypothetical protein [Acidobacteriaceae bacterium]